MPTPTRDIATRVLLALSQDTFGTSGVSTTNSTAATQNTSGQGWGAAARNPGGGSEGETWAQSIGTLTLAINTSNQGTATGATGNAVQLLGSQTTADAETLVRFTATQTSDQAGLVLRKQSGAQTYYRFRTTSTGVSIVKVITSTGTTLATGSFTWSAGSLYWLRARALGSNLYLRMWADGTSEPTTWTASIADSSITGAGGYGLHVNLTSTSDSIKFDSYVVTAATSPRVSLDISTRINVQGQPLRDIAVRARVQGSPLRDLLTRIRVQGNPLRDIATRIRIGLARDIATRILSQGSPLRDISTRERVQGQPLRDISTRARTQGSPLRDISTRARTQGSPLRDISTRIRSQGRSLRDIATRILAQGQGVRDILTRARVQGSPLRDIATRVRTQPFFNPIPAARDIACRICVQLSPSAGSLLFPQAAPSGFAGVGQCVPIPRPTMPYQIDGVVLLDQPTVCTAPLPAGAAIPAGATFSLTFNTPSSTTQVWLASGTSAPFTFAILPGRMVNGLCSFTSQLVGSVFTVQVTLLAPISLSTRVVATQFF